MNYLFAYEAELMMKDGFIREGIELCKKGLKEYPTYTVAYSVLANGYLLLNDFDSAFTTIEAALGRYPDNKSLLNIRSKLEDIFKSDNKFLIGDSVVKDYAIEQKFPEDKELIYKPDILTDAEIENKFHDYKSGNVILTDFTVTPFISPEFSTDLYNQVNNFENLRDLIASFKEEKQETVENIQVVEVDETSDKIEIKESDDYFTQLASKIGDGKINVKQEITKPTDSDDEPYIVSETMAQIYEIQKAYTTSIKVYYKLCDKFPEKKEKFLEKINELQKKVN